MWDTLHPSLQADALVLDNTVRNRGAAGSRNVGARMLSEYGYDWLIDISPVTRFGPSGGLDFVAQVEAEQDSWIVQASTPVNWHLCGWSRRLFERVGLFDENMHPVYGEDGDLAHRVHVAATEDVKPDAWACIDVDAWVTMYGHAQRLAGVQVDMERTIRYFDAKWGSGAWAGALKFDRPFGDERLPLSFWPTPPDPRAVQHEGWAIR